MDGKIRIPLYDFKRGDILLSEVQEKDETLG